MGRASAFGRLSSVFVVIHDVEVVLDEPAGTYERSRIHVLGFGMEIEEQRVVHGEPTVPAHPLLLVNKIHVHRSIFDKHDR